MFGGGNMDQLISLEEFATLMEESQERSMFDAGTMISRRLDHPEYGSIIVVQTISSSQVLLLKG